MRNRRNQLEYARFRTERKKRTSAGYSAKDKDLKSSTADVYLGCRLSAINKTWKKILTAEVKNQVASILLETAKFFHKLQQPKL